MRALNNIEWGHKDSRVKTSPGEPRRWPARRFKSYVLETEPEAIRRGVKELFSVLELLHNYYWSI